MSQHIITTPSTSTSSIQSKNLKPDEYTKGLDEEHISRLTDEAYKHFIEYTQAELKVTVEDCQLIENMNKMTKEKYSQMSKMSQRLMTEMSKLQNTYAEFSSFMQQIEDVHQQVVKMESIAKSLDEYSKYLENKLLKVTSK